MSILPVFLLVGVALSLHIGGHGNSAVLQPIVSKSQGHRICAELCSSGLGGESCGENCMDIAPQDLPIQSKNGTRTTSTTETRRDVCPMLCANTLGRPLCECDEESNEKNEIDYVQICGIFCVKYGHRINGCQPCDVYNQVSNMFGLRAYNTRMRRPKIRIDWNEWCKQKCLEGDGGAACNCDILPISIDVLS